uniref:Uncharacterized protein n=1 Tax=Kalanchoe fedtschenkoi TaxID=63787 RepID=A0A7N0RAJ3_KALFE
MGCGSSTLAAENPDIQARLRPMIKRCIDDVKRRRSVLKNATTLSKKELLLGGEDCDKMSSSNNNSRGRNSVPSDDSVQYGAAKIVPVVEWEEAETVVKSPEKNEVSREEGEQEKEKEKTGAAVDEDEGRCISPGSPSFRVYCVKSKDSATRNRRRIISRKFRRAMHKGGQVKSLMRVGSCYNPASCSAHDKAHLLPEAAAE